MSKGLRLSEKWFRRGLWLVAFVFAWFLIGLGEVVVGDLPKVESRLATEDFIDKPQAAKLRGEIEGLEKLARKADDALEQARLKAQVAQRDYQSARDSFNNWLATRGATQDGTRDAELVARTEALERLKQAERAAQGAVEREQQAALDARQREKAARAALAELERVALERLQTESRRQELRVFGYRLLLTLPLLALAAWLFVRKRRSTYWPFVWGFIIFAVVTFFVELVPYLPSYGGYVRYTVGIVMTVLIGRYAIVALNRYLERQREVEALPDADRRRQLAYDVALARLGKGVCPGCERGVDFKDTSVDFCPHCGIGLFDHCRRCSTRKSSFALYCHACGLAAAAAAPAAADGQTAPIPGTSAPAG
jgi:predicted RNA-binding Zn-ribbon protein involved in translation (DUF1610 family)